MKDHRTLTFVLLLICTGTGAASAQTADQLPPNQVTICDLEVGAANGLCRAYCEAMDCASAEPRASTTACGKVRTSFQELSGHDVPCELPCPCQTIPEFNAILAGVNFCFDAPQATFLTIQPLDPVVEYAIANTPIDVQPQCGYSSNVTNINIFLPITTQQAANCVAVLHEAAITRGVTCQQLPP